MVDDDTLVKFFVLWEQGRQRIGATLITLANGTGFNVPAPHVSLKFEHELEISDLIQECIHDQEKDLA